jgi:glycoside/pentoside/hexuronide:cation symporter, GPH family
MATEAANSPIVYQTTRVERTTYGLFFVGQNFFYILVLSFLQVFLTDAGITAAAVAGVFLVVKVWDAVNDPIFGVLIDRSEPKSGKFLPWIRASIVPIAITTILMFAMPSSLSLTAKIVWSAIAYVIWDLTYTLCDAPVYALMTAMTTHTLERTTMVSIGRIGGTLGAMIVSLAVPLMYPNIGWLGTAIIISVLGLLTMLPITRVAKERVHDKKEEAPSLGEIWANLRGNKYLLIFYASMIIFSLTNSMVVIAPYFAVNILGKAEMATLVIAVTAFPMLLIAAFVPRLVKRFGKFRLYLFFTIWFIVSSVLTYLVGYSNFAILMAAMLLRGIGFGFVMVMMFMFAPDCVEYGTFKSGNRAAGITFSMQSFAIKLTGGLSAALTMFILSLFGFAEGAGAVQTPAAIKGIWLLISIFPAIGALISLPIFLKYRLPEKDVEIMAQANSGVITQEEALTRLTKSY